MSIAEYFGRIIAGTAAARAKKESDDANAEAQKTSEKVFQTLSVRVTANTLRDLDHDDDEEIVYDKRCNYLKRKTATADGRNPKRTSGAEIDPNDGECTHVPFVTFLLTSIEV